MRLWKWSTPTGCIYSCIAGTKKGYDAKLGLELLARLKDELAKGYRTVVPHRLRSLLYFGRRSATTFFDHGYGPQFLTDWALLRVTAGFGLAHVRTNDLILTVNLQDYAIAGSLYSRGTWEPEETAFVKASVRPGMVVVDIGANLGYFTTLLASLALPEGKVVAFEPDTHNYGLLAKNVAQNHLTNVITINSALGAESGEATLYRFDDNFGNLSLHSPEEALVATKIRVETLDEVLARQAIAEVHFIKMDIQGYEPVAIKGMLKTLAQSRNLTMLTEFWPWGINRAGASVDSFLANMAELGFSAAVLEPGGVAQPIEYNRLPTLVANEKASFTNLVFTKTVT